MLDEKASFSLQYPEGKHIHTLSRVWVTSGSDLSVTLQQLIKSDAPKTSDRTGTQIQKCLLRLLCSFNVYRKHFCVALSRSGLKGSISCPLLLRTQVLAVFGKQFVVPISFCKKRYIYIYRTAPGTSKPWSAQLSRDTVHLETAQCETCERLFADITCETHTLLFTDMSKYDISHILKPCRVTRT